MARSTAKPQISDIRVPRHVAVIMDGNRRWAAERKLPKVEGHRRGANALKKVMEACSEIGVEHLSVYAFSSENWERSEDEVSYLMKLLAEYLDREVEPLKEKGVRIRFIGSRERLSDEIIRRLNYAEEATAGNHKFNLNVAIDYGSRNEMLAVCRRIAQKVANGDLQAEKISEADVAAELYTSHSPEPDLLIRTGGEQRLSNFLLWQVAYSELYFTKTLWPDFDKKEFYDAISDYSLRERRYGS